MRELKSQKNIKNIIRYDIKGDLLSNPSGMSEYILGGIQNLGNDGPHFDLARPGATADTAIETAVKKIKADGVKN